MAAVVYSARALGNLEAALRFIATGNPGAARASVRAIRSAIELLAEHPLLGRRLDGEIRELIISHGDTGYVALYRFVVPADEVRVLAIRHQRQMGYMP